MLVGWIEFCQNDRERWSEIGKVKRQVAKRLHIPSGSMVLDVLVWEADFSRAVAVSSEGSYVVAGEILPSDIKEAKRSIEKQKLKKKIESLRMDVTSMAFCNSSFDHVVDFAGWEDFTAISREEFIGKAFGEMTRVLIPNGIPAVTFILALESKDEISRKDKELQEFMYRSKKRPRFFKEEFFHQMFEKHRIRFLRRKIFRARYSPIR